MASPIAHDIVIAEKSIKFASKIKDFIFNYKFKNTSGFYYRLYIFAVLQLNERLDQWPHLKELIHCYTADWIKDETKYGHYEREAPPLFQNQIFECPDTDVETGTLPCQHTYIILRSL